MLDYEAVLKQARTCANRKYCDLGGNCEYYDLDVCCQGGEKDILQDAADAIEELLAERDRYKSFFDRITDLPDCNICLKKNICEFAPRPGEHTRINCAFCLTAPPTEKEVE